MRNVACAYVGGWVAVCVGETADHTILDVRQYSCPTEHVCQHSGLEFRV